MPVVSPILWDHDAWFGAGFKQAVALFVPTPLNLPSVPNHQTTSCRTWFGIHDLPASNNIGQPSGQEMNFKPGRPPWHLGHLRWKKSEPFAP